MASPFAFDQHIVYLNSTIGKTAMALFENILEEISEGILTITISRPKSLNALNSDTLEEIKLSIQAAYDNEEIKGVIITGSGDKAFIAGADIREVAELNELNARKFSESGQEVFNLIEQCEKPVIAAINGYALGGGCELAISCHLRIATEKSKFGQPEVNLGLIPGYGGTQRLTQLVGKGKALEIMMTGDMISAEEAKSIGLINHVVSSGNLMTFSTELMNKILSKAPLAIGMVINCVNAYYSYDENGYQTEANAFAHCTNTADFREGTTAFLEKRQPKFKGN